MTCENFQVLEPGQGITTATDFTPAEITFPYDNIEDLRVDIYDYGDNIWRNIPRNTGLVTNVNSNNPATSTNNDFYSWETYTDAQGRIGVRTVLATNITNPPLPVGRTARHPYAPNTGTTFPQANGANANVRVYRQTSIDAGELPATFYPGSAVKAEDLNANFEALRRVVEEGACGSGGGPNAQLDARYWNKTDTDTISQGDAWPNAQTADSRIATCAAGDARWLSSGGADIIGGSGITVDADTPAAGQITVRTDGNQVDIGTVRFGGNGNAVYTFPTADGQPNQVLQTAGNGTLSWVNQTAGQALTFRGSVDCSDNGDIPGITGGKFPSVINVGDVFTVETTQAQANVTANWQTVINGAGTGVTSGDLLVVTTGVDPVQAAGSAPDVRMDRIQTGGSSNLQAVCGVGNLTNTNIILDNRAQLQLREVDANGDNHLAIRAAAAMAADVLWSLPAAGPTNADELVLSASATGNNVQFQWVAGGGGASVSIGDNAPAAAAAGNAGDLWWNSDDGRLYISYNDANSAQWVDASPSTQQQPDRIVVNNTQVRVTDTGANGAVTTTIDGTDRILTNADGTAFDQNVTITSQNHGPLAGFRNQIINGDFRIAQRGTSFTANGYTLDRWYMDAGGHVARDTTPNPRPGATYFAELTNTNGQFQQMIELDQAGSNSQFAVGSLWTLSWYQNAGSTAMAPSVVFRDAAGVSANDTAVTQAVVEQVENNVNNWDRYRCRLTMTQAAATNTGLCVNFVYTANCNLTMVQLEPGVIQTPFEHRNTAMEMNLCHRYYYRIPNIASSGARFANGAGTWHLSDIFYPTVMRRQPTVNLTGVAGTGLATVGVVNQTLSGCTLTAGLNAASQYAVTAGNLDVNAEL